MSLAWELKHSLAACQRTLYHLVLSFQLHLGSRRVKEIRPPFATILAHSRHRLDEVDEGEEKVNLFGTKQNKYQETPVDIVTLTFIYYR